MDKAEEFFQSKNGGKSSILANKHGELISPIWAVELMDEYAQHVSREKDEEISQLKDIITSLENK